jgi:hypothetical protein
MNNYTHEVVHRTAESLWRTDGYLSSVRADQNPLERKAKIATYKMIGGMIIGRLEDHLQAEFLISGGEQLVFAVYEPEPIALKVLTRSMGGRKKMLEKQTAELQRITDKSKEYLGPQWIDTVFYTSSLPVSLGGRAILSTQPLINPIHSFEKSKDVADSAVEYDYTDRFTRLLSNIDALYKEWGLLPDLRGANNIVLAADSGQNELQVVDTIPETPEKLKKTLGEQQEIIRHWRGAALSFATKQTVFQRPAVR